MHRHFRRGGRLPLKAPYRVNDVASLQNGAKLFVNYCLNCHSASSMRYNKLRDIGLTDQQIKESLLFTGEKVGDMMHVAMTAKDAKKWFGTTPPDLSVIARAKSVNAGPSGSDYIYTYLRTFYRDTSRATGWNNLVFPAVGMPHALWERQGPRELTTVAMHEVEGKEGEPKTWEKVTTVYDAQGFANVKAEPVANYHGHATFEAIQGRQPGPSRNLRQRRGRPDRVHGLDVRTRPDLPRAARRRRHVVPAVVLPGNVAPERLLLEARTLTATPRQVFPSP